MSSLTVFNLGNLPKPTRTQADKLPDFKEVVIPNIKKLSTAKDIYLWGNCIQISLGARHLASLTSDTLPRPDVNNPRYNNWVKWSRLVSKWLVRNVDVKFTPHFQQIQAHLEFADTTYKEILALNIPKSPSEDRMTKELIRLWNMRRHQFSGVDGYVSAWRDQVLVCRDLTVGFDYLSATKTMLHEMEADMPVLAKFISLQLEEQEYTSNPTSMSSEQFNSIVRGIIGAVQKET